ncbi:hypothetical protein [Paraflavitalea pollutisoli]|uniref:hypothetical protein n=1 Tax=Paraflavitalea pollutisoli TaxID=3034143 RepID=UPI0023EC99DA|nr:hypothetical protein [Paraflavitalea sp. H1-2-19X]
MPSKLAALALLLTLTFAGCDKDNDEHGDARAGKGKVAFYELESATLLAGKCQVDPDNAKLSSSPIVGNNDIISYSVEDRYWEVSDAAWQRLSKLKDNQPMAITLNNNVVYYFVNKPNYSSSSCDQSITMQLWPKTPGFYTENRVVMSLGYPGTLAGVTITDRRNTPTLIHELNAQKKLQ